MFSFKNSFPRRARSGSALLLTILVLSVIVLRLVVASSAAFIQIEQRSIASRNKKVAEAGAVACMEHAMNVLGRNPGYGGGEVYTGAITPCTVRPVEVGAGTWVLKSEATVGMQTSRLQVRLSALVPPQIASWQEVASFP
ncbi:MAG: hypothetical protein Q8R07_04160 [Candidatus Uhrbacteria bacterium]|nr:hypothetical protein [Candidatus Uhrbacteria bacterium]